MEKTVFNDILYSIDGKIYTEAEIKSSSVYSKLKREYDTNFLDLKEGTEINCTYSQLFFEESSLIQCDKITKWIDGEDPLELLSGDEEKEIMQYFIIDKNTAIQLQNHTSENIYFHSFYEIYVLGVSHIGTNWNYVPAVYIK